MDLHDGAWCLLGLDFYQFIFSSKVWIEWNSTNVTHSALGLHVPALSLPKHLHSRSVFSISEAIFPQKIVWGRKQTLARNRKHIIYFFPLHPPFSRTDEPTDCDFKGIVKIETVPPTLLLHWSSALYDGTSLTFFPIRFQQKLFLINLFLKKLLAQRTICFSFSCVGVGKYPLVHT